MKHLGDITKLNGAEIPVVDCITGGSPCQDLSVAGLRKGMKHEANGDEETTRSGLFWLLRRISAQYERPATLGSLFDGIGGFPYCWERCNGKGTAIWASEIEEFPMAVTRVHFPEDSNG